MKLYAVYTARLVFHRVKSVVSQRRNLETRRHFGDVIAVTHPNVEFSGQPLEQATRHIEDFQTRVTELAVRRRDHGTAKLARKDLEPVTNAERGTVDRLQQLWMGFRSSVVVH